MTESVFNCRSYHYGDSFGKVAANWEEEEGLISARLKSRKQEAVAIIKARNDEA